MGPSEYPHISTKWPVCFPPPVLSGVVQTVAFFFAFFATSYCVTMSGVRMPAGARVVSFLQHIQTGQWPTQPPVHSSGPLSLLFSPVAHSASCSLQWPTQPPVHSSGPLSLLLTPVAHSASYSLQWPTQLPVHSSGPLSLLFTPVAHSASYSLQWPTQPPVHSSDPLSLLFTPIWSTVMFIPTGTLNFRVVAETNSESSNQEYLSCLWSPALIVTKRYATFIAFIVTLYESVWFKEIIWAHTICEAVSVEIHPHSSLTLGPLMEFMAWPLYSWGKRPLTCYTEGWNNFK